MLENAFEYLKNKLGNFKPDTAIILGSGLGGLISAIKDPLIIPYSEVPGFPTPSVAGHEGRFYAGKIGKRNVFCLQGRFHFYEGIDPMIVDAIIHMLKKLGIEQIIITNAAGSLRTSLPTGSLLLIRDHINLSGINPLIGHHEAPYFPDMSNAYDYNMRQNFLKIAARENITVPEGIYMMVLGPNYETKSEVRLFQSFGADAVGMSTVSEVISAVHKGIKVLGVSVISNLCTGLTDKEQDHDDVIHQVQKSSVKLGMLIQKFLEED
ncbi:MAG: purine-nucleoside phosphorylase [Alphaproteobacteria bacterium]|nr:purine-nucleoside phosphorylase [Alphaproteobacteria bacterium]